MRILLCQLNLSSAGHDNQSNPRGIQYGIDNAGRDRGIGSSPRNTTMNGGRLNDFQIAINRAKNTNEIARALTNSGYSWNYNKPCLGLNQDSHRERAIVLHLAEQVRNKTTPENAQKLLDGIGLTKNILNEVAKTQASWSPTSH